MNAVVVNAVIFYDRNIRPGTVDGVISDVREIGLKTPMKDHIRITPEGQVHLWWITTNDEQKTFCDALQQNFRDFQQRKARSEVRESLGIKDFNILDWGFNPPETHDQVRIPFDLANKNQIIQVGRRSSESCPVDEDGDTPRKRKKRSGPIQKTTGDGPTPVSASEHNESDTPRKRKRRKEPSKKIVGGEYRPTPVSEASKDPLSIQPNHSCSNHETELAVSNRRESPFAAIDSIRGDESSQKEPGTSASSNTAGTGVSAGDGKTSCGRIPDVPVPPEAEDRLPTSQLQIDHPTTSVPCEGNVVVTNHDTDSGHRLYLQDMNTSLESFLHAVHEFADRERNEVKEAQLAAESATTLASEKCRVSQDKLDQERARRSDAEKERHAVQALLDKSEHVLASEREAHAETRIALQNEQSKLATVTDGRRAAELDTDEANNRFNELTLAYADAHCQLRRECALRCDLTHRLGTTQNALADAKVLISTQKDKEKLIHEQLAFEQSELSIASEERKKIQIDLKCEGEARLKAEELYATAQETLRDTQRRLNDEQSVRQQAEALLKEELVVKAALIEHHRVTVVAEHQSELSMASEERKKLQMALKFEEEARLKAEKLYATEREALRDTQHRLKREENVRQEKETLLKEELLVKAALIEHQRLTEEQVVAERQARADAERAHQGVEEQLTRCQEAERTASAQIQHLMDEQRATVVEVNEQKQMAEKTLKQECNRRFAAEEQLQQALEALNIANDKVAIESAARKQADSVLSSERDKLQCSDDELTRERSARLEAERHLQEALEMVADAQCQATRQRTQSARSENALRTTVQKSKSAATIEHAGGYGSEHDLQSKAKYDTEGESLDDLLVSERERRRTAETMLASVRQECTAPFLIPALLDIFLDLAAKADGSNT